MNITVLPKEHHTLLVSSVLAVAAITLLVASTYKLSESPGIWLDEGIYTQLGMNIARVGQQALQVAPDTYVRNSYISVGYPLLYPLAFSYKMFGIGVLQGREVMVLFILLFALASYWLLRSLFGSWVGAWSILILESFPMLYGNGKSVLGEVPGLFFFIATLISLWYLEKNEYRDWRWYVAVGLAAGLCVATKPIFFLVIGALFLTLVVKNRAVSLSWSGFLIGLVALMVPILYWIHTQFGADITLQSLLSYYSNPYAAQQGYTLILQNATRFFTETTPVYTAMLFIIWAVALLIKRKMSRISSAELSAFFFCLLIIAAYLRLPGWYRYLFPAPTIALLFLPSALLVVFEYLQPKWSFLKNYAWLPYAVLVLLFSAQLYQTAHSSYVAQYYTSTRTRDVATAFSQLPKGASIFLYDVPELAVLLPTREYYQIVHLSPAIVIGTDQLTNLQKGTVDLVILNSSQYAIDTTLFSRYQPLMTVERYQILKRKY